MELFIPFMIINLCAGILVLIIDGFDADYKYKTSPFDTPIKRGAVLIFGAVFVVLFLLYGLYLLVFHPEKLSKW